MPDSPLEWPIHALGRALRSGRLGVVELTRLHLERIAALDPALHHFHAVMADRALAQARQAEDALRGGRDRGALHGIPYGVKDVFDVAGSATTCNSRLRLDHRAVQDSAVVARMGAAGAVLLGKLATSEFACGGADDAAPFPVARNPWDVRRYTGGSSSGSAGAVAAGMLRLAVGSDTGGSTRVPASYCGVVGMKPSFGFVPSAGLFPLAPTLDHVGLLGPCVADVALALGAIACVPVGTEAGELDLGGLSLGYARALVLEAGATEEAVAAVDDLVAMLRGAGARVEEIVLPDYATLRACYNTLLLSEAFAIHAPDLRARPDGYGRATRERLMAGEGVSAGDREREQARRDELRARIDDILRTRDAILLPTALGEAPLLPPAPSQGSPTMLANLTGHPALSLPSALSRAGMPLGVQIVGRARDDAGLLTIGRALEAAIEFADRFRPPLHALVPAV